MDHLKIESKYLEAIRNIPGETHKEKFRYLHTLAHELASECKLESDFKIIKKIVSNKICEELQPLVLLFVSKKIKCKEGITASLISNNELVFKKALKTKWFFKENYLPEFYDKEIFSVISIKHRKLLLKRLSGFFAELDKCIVDNFHRYFKDKIINMDLLLPSCSYEYVCEKIKEKNFKVSYILMFKSIRRDPRILLNFLSLDNYSRTYIYAIDNKIAEKMLHKDIKIFPELLRYISNDKKRFNFGNNLTKKILRLFKDVVVKTPGIVADCFRLDIVTKMLTTNEILSCFFKLIRFKASIEKTPWNLIRFLERNKKIEIARKAFKMMYGIDFFENAKSYSKSFC